MCEPVPACGSRRRRSSSRRSRTRSSEIIPAKDLDIVLDNIGLPASNYNLAFNDGSFVAYNDGQILISLKPGHASTAGYMRDLRRS